MKAHFIAGPVHATFASESCPDHWFNVIVYGRCECPRVERIAAARQEHAEKIWKRV